MTVLPLPPGATNVYPQAINDRGEVVGYWTLYDAAVGSQRVRPFTWSHSSGFIDIGAISVSGSTGYATDIDESGRVVGSVFVEGAPKTFVWNGSSSSAPTLLSIPSGGRTVAANGRIAGSVVIPSANPSYASPYRMDIESDRFEELPVASEYGGGVFDLNESGEAAGYDGFPDTIMGGWGDATVWDAAGKRTKVYPCAQYGDCVWSYLVSINIRGSAIGRLENYNDAARLFRWSRSGGIERLNLPDSVHAYRPAVLNDDESILLLGKLPVYRVSAAGHVTRMSIPNVQGRTVEVAAVSRMGTFTGRIY